MRRPGRAEDGGMTTDGRITGSSGTRIRRIGAPSGAPRRRTPWRLLQLCTRCSVVASRQPGGACRTRPLIRCARDRRHVELHEDFLIIGSGIAGLRAAAELAAVGRVLILTKA